MKKIVKWVLIALVVGLAVKICSGRTIGEHLSEKSLTIYTTNQNAKIGETLLCPICRQSFEKTDKEHLFDSEECRVKYGKTIEKNEKERDFLQGAENVVKETGNAFKNAISNEVKRE